MRDGSLAQRRSRNEPIDVMKVKSALPLAVVLAAAPALAAPGWHRDLATARKLAAGEKKDLLLDFTGSDWCSSCIKLKKEVFSHKEFQDGVADKFVLVELDFPRDKSILTNEMRAQNERLKEEYRVRAFPTVLLCDAKGRPYAQTGYRAGGPEAYLEHLEEALQQRVVRDEALAKAAEAKGKERAAMLEKALAIVPGANLLSMYKKEYEELAKLAPGCKLVSAVESAGRAREQSEEFRKFFTDADYEGAIRRADGLVEAGRLKGKEKQQVLFYKLNAYMAMEKIDEALKVVDEIKSAGPDSRFGKEADRFRLHLEALKLREKQVREAKRKEGGAGQGKLAKPKSKSGALPEGEERRGLLTREKPAPAGDDASAKKENEGKPSEAGLKKHLAETQAELEAVTRKLADDHQIWEKTEQDMEASKKAIAKLQGALEREQAKYRSMEQTIERIEKEHNADHDREAALQKQREERQKALENFEDNQDEITKLEKQAEKLRRQAEELRKRAEELRKN